MLDDTLSARNKLQKFMDKLLSEQAMKNDEYGPYNFELQLLNIANSSLLREEEKMREVVSQLDSLYDELAGMQAEAKVNGMTAMFLGLVTSFLGTFCLSWARACLFQGCSRLWRRSTSASNDSPDLINSAAHHLNGSLLLLRCVLAVSFEIKNRFLGCTS